MLYWIYSVLCKPENFKLIAKECSDFRVAKNLLSNRFLRAKAVFPVDDCHVVGQIGQINSVSTRCIASADNEYPFAFKKRTGGRFPVVRIASARPLSPVFGVLVA